MWEGGRSQRCEVSSDWSLSFATVTATDTGGKVGGREGNGVKGGREGKRVNEGERAQI